LRLNVMTLNLLHGGAINPAGGWSLRLPRVLELLAGDLDLVGLQEATVPQLDDLATAAPEWTIATGPPSGESRLPRVLRRARGWISRRKAGPVESADHARFRLHGTEHRGEHCAILFRKDRFELVDANAFWVSPRTETPGSVLPGTWLPRVVNWVRLRDRATEGLVTHYNAHLDFLPWAPHRSIRILRHMLDRHWDGTPQILTGDFNTIGESKAYRHLCSEIRHGFHPALIDAWTAAAERVGPGATYHGGTGRPRWTGRLDRILFRPDFVVDRAETLVGTGDGHASDHFPVTARLRRRT